MNRIEQYQLYDRIIKFVGNCANGRATEAEFNVKFIDNYRARSNDRSAIITSNEAIKNNRDALKYLIETGYIIKTNSYFKLQPPGQDKLLHGFESEYVETESDKMLSRKNLAVSIQLTEKQIIDIGKAKRRSWWAIGISISALLVTSSFEGYKIYIENKKTKTEDPTKNENKPTENNTVIPEIKNTPDTFKEVPHNDSTEIKNGATKK